jgi:hypothetical protein
VTLVVPEIIMFSSEYDPYEGLGGGRPPEVVHIFEKTNSLLEDPDSVLFDRQRDTTHVFAGVNIIGAPSGIALKVGATCLQRSFAVSAQLTTRTSIKIRGANVRIVAHELGHVLGAGHTTGNQSSCSPGTPANTLMTGTGVFFGDVDERFAQCSQEAIENHLQAATCVEHLAFDSVRCGDVNRDGSISVVDGLEALMLAVEPGYDPAADVALSPFAPNRTVRASDALSILRVAVGLRGLDELVCAMTYEFPRASTCDWFCFQDDHCGPGYDCIFMDNICLQDCVPKPQDGCTFECDYDGHCFENEECVLLQDPCVKRCTPR